LASKRIFEETKQKSKLLCSCIFKLPSIGVSGVMTFVDGKMYPTQVLFDGDIDLKNQPVCGEKEVVKVVKSVHIANSQDLKRRCGKMGKEYGQWSSVYGTGLPQD
jgi:hypothetical protein